MPQLREHATKIFTQVPGWNERVIDAGELVLPMHNQLALENKISDFIGNLANTGQVSLYFLPYSQIIKTRGRRLQILNTH